MDSIRCIAYGATPDDPKVVRFAFKQDDDGLKVILVDEDGVQLPSGNVLKFYNANGRLYRFSSVNMSAGLDREPETGRIALANK